MVETGFRDGVAREAERAVLIGAILPQRESQREGVLDELARLADTAGATIVGELTQKLHRPHASAFYGKGKAEELGELARAIPIPVQPDAERVVVHLWHRSFFYMLLAGMMIPEWFLRRRRARA